MRPKVINGMCWLACRVRQGPQHLWDVDASERWMCVLFLALLGIPTVVGSYCSLTPMVGLPLPCRNAGAGHILCPFWKLPNTYIGLSLLSFPLGLCDEAVL